MKPIKTLAVYLTFCLFLVTTGWFHPSQVWSQTFNLSWNGLPSSQTYNPVTPNASSLQFTLANGTANAVTVEQLVLTENGSLNPSSEIAAGSVSLFTDSSIDGLYNISTALPVTGANGLSFSNGSVTFVNSNGLFPPLAGSSSTTLLLTFNLQALGGDNFNNSISASSILAVDSTGTTLTLSGGS